MISITARLLSVLLLLVGPATAQTVLPAGGALDGDLDASSDQIPSGEFAALYAFVSDGSPFEVRLTSSMFDTYLFIRSPSGEQYDNDDHNGSTAESVVQVGPDGTEPGRWEVTVTTYEVGETGPFRLSTRPLDAASVTTRTVTVPVAVPVQLVLGAATEGAITAESDTFSSGERSSEYRLTSGGLPFEIRVTSSTIDASIFVRSPSEQWYDDVGYAGSMRGTLVGVGPADAEVGEWTVTVVATELGAEGEFQIATRLLNAGEAAAASVATSAINRADSLAGVARRSDEGGDYERARTAAEEVMAIREVTLGPDHLDTATAAGNLANILRALGDYTAARLLYEQVLAVRERSFGPDHPQVVLGLNNLAALLNDQADYAAARLLYERALRIMERTLGPDDPDVALSLNNLAGVLETQGDLAGSRSLYERALAIQERALGPDHPDVGVTIGNLAYVLGEQGDLGAARPLYERALAIRERALGPDHPGLVAPLTNLALFLQEQGDSESAVPLYKRSTFIQDTFVDQILPSLSLAEQRAFVALNLGLLTSAILSSDRGGGRLDAAYSVVAGWKGLLLEGLRRQTAIAALADDPALAPDVAALAAVRARIAATYDTAPADTLAALTARKERLERRLATALPEGALADRWRDAGPDGLRAALPPGSALADVFRYHRLERGQGVGWRYAAIVTGHDAAPALVDLGPASRLDSLAGAWRAAVLRSGSAAAETAALSAALWGPITAALPPGTVRLWVSPDGDLVRVPWATLAEGHAGAGLLVAQVPSARDLLARLETPAPPDDRTALLVGDVAFGGDGVPFAPLPGTQAEVTALAGVASATGRRATALGGSEATAQAVRAAMPGASTVHLATHGYFSGESAEAYAARGARQGVEAGVEVGEGADRRAASRNPLAESGLAFAGANGGTADGPDARGTLTAEELVGLDLAGTRLVVLSACETGRGAEVTGQGVLGLQAAFAAAGARTLVMSLWSVPDAATAALMTAFYRGLWEGGLGPAAALRAAQAEVRAAPSTSAPVNWAAWVLVGDAF